MLNWSIIRKIRKLFWKMRDLPIRCEQRRRIKEHPNPLARFGKKVFSQTDEDGITFEIWRRIQSVTKQKVGAFVEFGVGNGTENNTLALLALGWTGYWFGGEKLLFSTKESSKLTFKRSWVTKENILELCKSANAQNADFISLDLDGNDYYFAQELLENKIQPNIFVVEYNSKFIPPIRYTVEYSATRVWKYDDYFGASLQIFDDLFQKHHYTLVCCNAASGGNAFFVKNDYAHLFPEVPKEINQIYSDHFCFLPTEYGFGHKQSLKTIKQLLK